MIPDPLANPPARPEGSTLTRWRRGGGGRSALSRYLLPDTAEVEPAGRLRIGGVDVLDLVSEVGTPVFVYDEEHLRRRCREARQACGPGVAYASKAFLCKAMAALAYEEGCCIDVSTGGELAVALAAGVPGDRLVLHGNNKSEAELEAALDAGVGRIVVDSFDEIDRLARVGRASGAGRAATQRPRPGHARASRPTPTST